LTKAEIKNTRVRILVELDQDLLTEIDQARGEVELPYMLGLIVKFGFNGMKLLGKEHWREPTT
jgi:hypothetical protein